MIARCQEASCLATWVRSVVTDLAIWPGKTACAPLFTWEKPHSLKSVGLSHFLEKSGIASRQHFPKWTMDGEVSLVVRTPFGLNPPPAPVRARCRFNWGSREADRPPGMGRNGME